MTSMAAIAVSLMAVTGCGNDEQPTTATTTSDPATARRVEITVTDSGYEPAEITAQAGEPLTLVFRRTTESSCAEELVIPDQDVRRDLPLNEPVEIAMTPARAGRITFTCGMNMLEGAIVVR